MQACVIVVLLNLCVVMCLLFEVDKLNDSEYTSNLHVMRTIITSRFSPQRQMLNGRNVGNVSRITLSTLLVKRFSTFCGFVQFSTKYFPVRYIVCILVIH